MFKRKNKSEDPEGPNQLSKAEMEAMLANCKCGKKSDFPPNTWRVESVPEARVRDKIGRNNAWDVTTSSFDAKSKSMAIEHIISIDKTEVKTFSHEDICNEFGWKSFSVSDNQQTLYPKW